MSALAQRTRRSLEIFRTPLQLAHPVRHSNVPLPAFQLLIEEFQSAHVMSDGGFEQLLSLRLRRKGTDTFFVCIRQWLGENAARYRFRSGGRRAQISGTRTGREHSPGHEAERRYHEERERSDRCGR
jgi:hypothetical protein